MATAQALQVASRGEDATARQVFGLGELANDLNPVAARWYMFGLLIGVPVEELEAIKGRGDRIDHCFQSVLLEWLKSGPSPRTKAALLEALRGNTLREIALAADLEESISQDSFSMKDLPLLIEKLSPMSARWNLLGIQLGIDLNLLNGFAQENNDVKLYFAETLSFWSKQRKPPSALMKALRSSTFRYIYLAENLKDKYGTGEEEDEEEVDYN